MSFLAPAFLAGLLAIGIPLWLHRLSAENPNRRPFSSTMFLEAGEPQRVLAKKLQYLLLLAFRIAVIAALVLAFIQPVFRTDPAAGAAGDQRLSLIVVDTSASMAADDRWDDAVDTAIDLIDETAVSDPVQIVAASRVIEVVTDATLDKAAARQAVQSLEPDVFFVDFGQLTRALDGVLRSATLPVTLHLVTDAQQSGMPTRFAELAPTEPIEIQVHQIASGSEPNWTIESLTGSAQTGELVATVVSHADSAADRRVQIELNGSPVEEQSITLAPGERATLEFEPLMLREGSNRVRVAMTPGDSLVGDDERMLALKRPIPHSVLLVRGSLQDRNDTAFFATALNILEGLAFDARTVDGSALRDENFEDYEFVIIADAAALTESSEDRLRTYVETGGGLLLALGPRSQNLSQVPITGQAFASTPVRRNLPAGGASVGALDTSHPALAGLDTIRSARFSEYNAVVPGPDDEVLISLETGDPLLIESQLGNGRLLIYTSSLNRDWNDLPREPVFVPFVAGVADHLLGGAGFTNEAALGSTLALQAMGMSGGQIFDPSGDSVLGLGGAGADVLLDQIGFYELVGGGRTELVAVNFDARESDLTPIDADALIRWQNLSQAADAVDTVGGTVQEEVQVPIGYWLLLLLLAAVIMESAIGNWHLRVRRGMAA